MDDRELIELAAKAAGLRTKSDRNSVWIVDDEGSPVIRWRPLTYDGDALRLAVVCGIAVTPYPIYSNPKHSVIAKQYRLGGVMREANPTEAVEVYGDDQHAATRRAIVRAAAAIGEAMK